MKVVQDFLHPQSPEVGAACSNKFTGGARFPPSTVVQGNRGFGQFFLGGGAGGGGGAGLVVLLWGPLNSPNGLTLNPKSWLNPNSEPRQWQIGDDEDAEQLEDGDELEAGG